MSEYGFCIQHGFCIEFNYSFPLRALWCNMPLALARPETASGRNVGLFSKGSIPDLQINPEISTLTHFA